MAALVPPTSNLASSRDATLDIASGRQRRIFDLSVAILCDRRLTAVGSRGKGGAETSQSLQSRHHWPGSRNISAPACRYGS